MRRIIVRHAFIFLTVAFLLGLVAGVTGGNHHPHARLWMGAHITGILVALMVAIVGLMWPELELGRRAARILYAVTIPANYFIMAVLGVLAPAMGFPQAIATPDLPSTAAWVHALVAATLVIATVSNLSMSGLMIYGLRARPGA
jgi:hypothetical protein